MFSTADQSTKTDADCDAALQKSWTTRNWFIVAAVIWAAAIAVGFSQLMQYAATPGTVGLNASHWPTKSRIKFDPDKANLVLLAHPQCPCTCATMDEFERLMARCQGLASANVVFYVPGDAQAGWEKSGLCRRAAAIPGVRVLFDEGGNESKLLGVNTSGHLLLFDRNGRRAFSGGITNARGHAGGSLGAESLRALLTSGASDRSETPVYGCPLDAPLYSNPQGDAPCCK